MNNANKSLRFKEEKGIAMKRERAFIRGSIWLLILLTAMPSWVFAQDQPANERFQQEELDQMLAPIALYPDSLLAQILMAATYPLEVVQAEQWTKANKNLGPDQLNDALDNKDWDPSVKALVPFRQVLLMMSENLEWTQRLGDAFLDQQDDVMDTIQKLRRKAEAAGNLRDTQEEKVIVDGDVIDIEPAQPDEVYVPVYDPAAIYGDWWYPAFPPFFFLPPRGVVIGFHGAMGFGVGIAVGGAWGRAWGHWDWRNHSVNVNINRHININRNMNITRTSIQTTRWQHDPSHRRGISYRSKASQERYGQMNRAAVDSRRDFRGFETKGGQAPGAIRPGVGQTRDRTTMVNTRPGLPETRGWQAPVVSQQGLDRSRDRSAFGGMEQGSNVQRQSDRGRQSRQSMPLRGGATATPGNVGRRR